MLFIPYPATGECSHWAGLPSVAAIAEYDVPVESLINALIPNLGMVIEHNLLTLRRLVSDTYQHATPSNLQYLRLHQPQVDVLWPLWSSGTCYFHRRLATPEARLSYTLLR